MVKTVIAKDLDQALDALNQEPYRIVAGGTDMLIQNRSHTGLSIAYKGNVLYINQVDELRKIKEDHKQLMIGATVRLEEILKDQRTPKLLKDIIIEMASPAIRHTGTLAGNIANASPAGDSLPALYLLDASVKLQSKDKTRIIKVSNFIKGVRKIDLNKDEMITEIIIPKLDFDIVSFIKVAPRRSDAISKLSFAGAVRFDGDEIIDLRLALGAVYMTVVRNRELENKYIGSSKNKLKNQVDEVLKDYNPLIQPIDDQRSNKIYRKKVALNLIKDFISKI
jgi:CO/xanthine dehydrogenase FAD-binding subunit